MPIHKFGSFRNSSYLQAISYTSSPCSLLFIPLLFDDADVLVEAEDGAGKEERLGNVVEQAGGDVVGVDYLVGYEGDAAHDEQYRTSILGCFKACVFHGIRSF